MIPTQMGKVIIIYYELLHMVQSLFYRWKHESPDFGKILGLSLRLHADL